MFTSLALGHCPPNTFTIAVSPWASPGPTHHENISTRLLTSAGHTAAAGVAIAVSVGTGVTVEVGIGARDGATAGMDVGVSLAIADEVGVAGGAAAVPHALSRSAATAAMFADAIWWFVFMTLSLPRPWPSKNAPNRGSR
jgi:hypothetical protein